MISDVKKTSQCAKVQICETFAAKNSPTIYKNAKQSIIYAECVQIYLKIF